MNVRFAGLLAWLVLALPVGAQERFKTPDAAVDELVQTVSSQTPDESRLAKLFGSDWRNFVPVGSVDREDVASFLAMYAEGHAFQPGEKGRKVLAVGNNAWTFPIPLAQDGRGWFFDTHAGAEELKIRRIGRDELDAQNALRAYHDAQMEYATEDHDGDGVMEYAPKLVSTDGLHDGLYWADDDSGKISPLGPLFGDDGPTADWKGYRYKALSAQGASAPGGAFNYNLAGNQVRGFAAVAWPAQYGVTGIKSFAISHDGTLFEIDLGPDGEQSAKKMEMFDPDSSWTEVKQ